MASEVKTGFEIAFYFLNKAEINSDHLQPQKLQRLLFLAQTYYIIGYDRALMPAVFIADERGPMEPNLFAAFSRGKPEIDVDTFLSDEIKKVDGTFVSIWHNESLDFRSTWLLWDNVYEEMIKYIANERN